MNKKRVIFVLLFLSILYFLVFIYPNNTGAKTVEMISVFEPDEFAQYPHAIRMLEFKGISLRHKIWHFVAYQHYYYGFPFYALSVLALLPVKFLSGINNVQLNMAVLRQFVSVLPMITTFWLLVYIQTKFEKFWKSIILFIFLLSIPIVIKNNLWWHPDSLAILFCVLVIFFLSRDQYRFGANFNFAAIAVGLAIGTKNFGWFFFLTIFVYLFLGYKNENIQFQKILTKSVVFIILMISVVIISNPALIHPEERMRYLMIQKAQSAAMSFGWDVAYQKGPGSWFSIISEYYGHWLTLLLILLGIGIGLYKKETRLTNILILTWVFPMLIYILFFVATKPKHLLMPIALPFFSSLVNFIPPIDEEIDDWKKYLYLIIPSLILLIQFGRNVIWDFQYINNTFHREETHPALSFYSKIEPEIFACLPDGHKMTVFRDVRAYVPESENLNVEISWKAVDYTYIKDLNPEIIVLQMQKINDYTSSNLIEDAFDKDQMRQTQIFYSDAKNMDLEDYQFQFGDNYGMIFLRDDISDLLSCPIDQQ